ncbi:transcription factor 7-like [Corythoichthys intestinalis]|uniref:transcription factor 7-like n=1 Tax=Corythoichthys intestinalis TaxID=161448 RepID=UPI0025A544D7|nr:transcription factor 7-like [Corythoichthys intestinalis]
MDQGELVMCEEMAGDASDPSLPPNRPLFCDEPDETIYTELRTVEGEVDGSGVWFPIGKRLEFPNFMSLTTSTLEWNSPGFMMPYSQGLSLPYEWGASPFNYHPYEDPTLMMDSTVSVEDVRIDNLNKIEEQSPLPSIAATSAIKSHSRKRSCEDQHDGKRREQYIKKPLNAFMLFRQEQRPKVVAMLKIRNSADVNKVIGQMWKSLTKREQRKYYELADAAKKLHTQQHPDWSCTENYGKKRKRQRVKDGTNSKVEDTCQAVSPDEASVECDARKQESHHTVAMAQNQLRRMLDFML